MTLGKNGIPGGIYTIGFEWRSARGRVLQRGSINIAFYSTIYTQNSLRAVSLGLN